MSQKETHVALVSRHSLCTNETQISAKLELLSTYCLVLGVFSDAHACFNTGAGNGRSFFFLFQIFFNFPNFIHSRLCGAPVDMANPKKTSSLFDEDDDDDEGLSRLRAKRATATKGGDNPLSFFSFGSSGAPATPVSKPPPASKVTPVSDDEDDADDDFFKSPPSSFKQPVKKTSTSAFDLSEEDEIELPRDSLSGSLLSELSFKSALGANSERPASADPVKSGGASLGDNTRISALEEQLAKANRTIKKLQDKAKTVCIAILGEYLY